MDLIDRNAVFLFLAVFFEDETKRIVPVNAQGVIKEICYEGSFAQVGLSHQKDRLVLVDCNERITNSFQLKKNETFVGRWADSSAGSFQGNDVQNEPVPTSFRLFVKCHQEIASVHVGQFLKINCEFMGAVTLDATTIRHVFNTTDGSGGNSFCVLTVLSRQYIAMAVPVRKFFKKYQFYSTEFWGKILFVSKIRLQ